MSGFLNLNWMDVLKGFILAFLTVLLTTVVQTLNVGAIPDWATFQTDLLMALGAGVAYLIKNFFSNSGGVPLKPEVK